MHLGVFVASGPGILVRVQSNMDKEMSLRNFQNNGNEPKSLDKMLRNTMMIEKCRHWRIPQ